MVCPVPDIGFRDLTGEGKNAEYSDSTDRVERASQSPARKRVGSGRSKTTHPDPRPPWVIRRVTRCLMRLLVRTSFTAQPPAPASRQVDCPLEAGACGWEVNESFTSTSAVSCIGLRRAAARDSFRHGRGEGLIGAAGSIPLANSAGRVDRSDFPNFSGSRLNAPTVSNRSLDGERPRDGPRRRQQVTPARRASKGRNPRSHVGLVKSDRMPA